MARPRRPVKPLQEVLKVQPVAQPVDTFARPNVASKTGYVGLSVLDFRAISATLGGLFSEVSAGKKAKQAKEDQLAGERFVAEKPDLVRHLEKTQAEIPDAELRRQQTIKDLEFLQRNGLIPDAANPNWRIGYARAAGRLLAREYQATVRGEIDKVSAVVDEKGNPLPAGDPEAVISKAWEQFAKSPAVQSVYGGREALRLKEEIDNAFRAEVADRRAQNLEKAHQDNLASEIGGMFDAILAGNQAVTSDDLQPITEYLDKEVRGHSVLDPRGVTMRALELSIRRAASVDGEEGVRAVHAAQDLVVGGVRLGDDRGEVGLRLQELSRQVREQSKSQAQLELQQEDIKRRRIIQQAESEYIPLIMRAKAEGVSVQETARRYAETVLQADADTGKYGGRGAFVVDAVNEYARASDQARSSDRAVLDQFGVLVSKGELDSADALITHALGSRSLTGEDYASLSDIISKRRDTTSFVEANPVYNSIKGRYGSERATGYSPEIQQRLDRQADDLLARMTDDYATFVRTTAGSPDREQQHRAWLEERWQADQKTLRTVQDDIRQRRNDVERDVRQRLVRYQDAGPAIDEAERAGSLTIVEAQNFREENNKAAEERKRFHALPDFSDASTALARKALSAEAGGATPENLRTNDYVQRELRDRLDAALDDFLPTADPRSFEARARSEIRRIERELTDEVFPSATAKATEVGLKGGQSAEKAKNAADLLGEDLGRSQQWSAQVALNREAITARMFTPTPGVPADFYRYAAGWMSGQDPIFGSPVERRDVEMRARAVLRDPSLNPEARSAVLSIIGISPQEYLLGKATLGFDEDVRAELEYRLARIPFSEGRAKDSDEVRAIRAQLEPVEVDLTDVQLNPYTTPWFRSEEAFKAFREDPAYPTFLQRLGIDPDDEEARAAWEGEQHMTIIRTNP